MASNQALETLFYPIEQGLAAKPTGAVLFLNAAPCEGLAFLQGCDVTLQQVFKPYADAVPGAVPDFPEGLYDYVFIHTPKNLIEAQFFIASGIERLKEGGFLFCAAANDAGGGRLEKLLTETGFENIQTCSKYKARAVWAQKQKITPIVNLWKNAGALQSVGPYISQAGIFGWDKIDLGSKVLAEHLPLLSGRGADFGCGYGYLSVHVLKSSPDVKELFCIDADKRAVKACEENLKSISVPLHFSWQDLTQISDLKNLDFIIMNPPFHEGKSVDTDIGVSFIVSAAAALKKDGVLWMVANSRLPYEETLAQNFSKVEKKFQGSGFKIFCAVK